MLCTAHSSLIVRRAYTHVCGVPRGPQELLAAQSHPCGPLARGGPRHGGPRLPEDGSAWPTPLCRSGPSGPLSTRTPASLELTDSACMCCVLSLGDSDQTGHSAPRLSQHTPAWDTGGGPRKETQHMSRRNEPTLSREKEATSESCFVGTR